MLSPRYPKSSCLAQHWKDRLMSFCGRPARQTKETLLAACLFDADRWLVWSGGGVQRWLIPRRFSEGERLVWWRGKLLMEHQVRRFDGRCLSHVVMARLGFAMVYCYHLHLCCCWTRFAGPAVRNVGQRAVMVAAARYFLYCYYCSPYHQFYVSCHRWRRWCCQTSPHLQPSSISQVGCT